MYPYSWHFYLCCLKSLQRSSQMLWWFLALWCFGDTGAAPCLSLTNESSPRMQKLVVIFTPTQPRCTQSSAGACKAQQPQSKGKFTLVPGKLWGYIKIVCEAFECPKGQETCKVIKITAVWVRLWQSKPSYPSCYHSICALTPDIT